MNRREFLAGAVTAAAIPAAVAVETPKAPTKAGGKMKFCAFADLHFSPGIWPNGTPAFLDGILARARKENVDLVIHLGDFVHRVDRSDERDLVKTYNGFEKPTYHVLGNHDGERGEGGYRKAMEAYGMPKNYYHFDVNGWRFIVMDSNYYLLKDGTYVHYEGRNLYGDAPRMKWGCCLPPDEVAWLRETIAASPYPCVLFSHASVERSYSVRNGEEIRAIIDAANRERPGKVRLVINGHHHVDHLSVLRGVVYFDMNSANYYYYGKKHAKYPREALKAAAGADQVLAWNDPLSSIITLEEGRIRISGSRSSYYLGVTPEAAGYRPVDEEGRVIAPISSSFSYER